MEQTQKTVEAAGKTQKKSAEQGIMKISEMSKEDIRKLPICPFTILRQVAKKSTQEHFSISFEINPKLTLSSRLEQADFYTIAALYGAQDGYNRYKFKCHYRISYGLRNGQAASDNIFDPEKYYFYAEMIVSKEIIRHVFLTGAQVRMIPLCKLDKVLTFEERTESDDQLESDMELPDIF